ncbi:MAG: cytochrome P450 [Sphingomonas fennica]
MTSEPTGLPTLTLDPFSDGALADPYAVHATLRDAGPVFYLERYGIYGMARHAEVTAALKDFETYCSGRGVGLTDFSREAPWRPPSLLLETDPPKHERTRSLMMKVVSPRALKAVRPMWEARATDLASRIAEHRHADAVIDLAEVFPLMIFPDTIGLPKGGRHLLLDYAAATFNAFGPRNALFEETNARAAPAIEWVANACKRANLTDDGWGMDVYRAADAGLCTEDEAERLVRSFLSAGVDTTINGIGNMMFAFVDNPDQWALLRANPTLIKKTFEEALRWDSTVQTFFRTTTRDVAVEGGTIPEGAKVMLFYGAANRDPRRWAEPDRFDIQRAASGHVAFGYGIHQCLGQMVARLESEVLLEALLPRIAEIRPSGPPVRRLNNTLHALASLPAEFVPA